MTLQEELERAIDDRDMNEIDIDILNSQLIEMERAGIGEEDDDYNRLTDEINSLQNEVYYLDHVVSDLKEQISAN